MNFIKAEKANARQIYDLVQHTIKNIYPLYYTPETVAFFCEHHGLESIRKDIENENTYITGENGVIYGTITFCENYIARLFVAPEFQNRGIGGFLLNEAEKKISESFNKINLDASLAAVCFYEKSGYKTFRHERIKTHGGYMLVYDVMEKSLE